MKLCEWNKAQTWTKQRSIADDMVGHDRTEYLFRWQFIIFMSNERGQDWTMGRLIRAWECVSERAENLKLLLQEFGCGRLSGKGWNLRETRRMNDFITNLHFNCFEGDLRKRKIYLKNLVIKKCQFARNLENIMHNACSVYRLDAKGLCWIYYLMKRPLLCNSM